MNRYLTIALSTMLSALPALLFARDLTPDEQAFFDAHASDMVKVRVEAQRLDAPAVEKLFSVPIYAVKLILAFTDSEETSNLIVVRNGDKLVGLSRPSSDDDLPDFQKMLNPDFKLRTDADAKTLQLALDAAYPIVGDDDKKAEVFHHTGHTWVFVRGNFFDSKLGYLFETDASGAIKSVKYLLKLP